MKNLLCLIQTFSLKIENLYILFQTFREITLFHINNFTANFIQDYHLHGAKAYYKNYLKIPQVLHKWKMVVQLRILCYA